MKIIVLGAGLVGRPMAIDLCKDAGFEVAIADINQHNLDQVNINLAIKKIKSDLSDPLKIKEIISEYPIVLNALPGFLGFQTLKAVIEAGKSIVDISFFPEDPFVLDKLAQQKKVVAIMDMGVAPGMSHLLTGYVHHLMDKTDKVEIYVGGLPVIRELPFEYKAVFSPIDVIEEYTRPARLMEKAEVVYKEALTEPELMNFDGVGTLEAFNSDGLRSLVYTINCPDMKEKTLRYPGHIEKMKLFRETGFFSYDPIDLAGTKIRPIDLTSKLLFPKWKLNDGEEDLTVMKILVEGYKNGKKLRYTYDLLDKYDPLTKTHSMARTTGYTATMAVRMIAEGLYMNSGLSVPEYIGRYPDCVKFILDGLAQRGIFYKEQITEII
jgi:lysine 6-dehydrogenase